jgi:hypothetical protein
MSKDQIKSEINKVLDHFSDNALEELLTFLKNLKQKNMLHLNEDLLNRILTEDKGLLARLAK